MADFVDNLVGDDAPAEAEIATEGAQVQAEAQVSESEATATPDATETPAAETPDPAVDTQEAVASEDNATPDKATKGMQDALAAERKKRQEAEANAAYLRGLMEGRNPQQKEQPKGPTPEEIEQEYFKDPAGFVQRQVNHVAQSLRFEALLERTAVDEERMRSEVEDFEDAYKAFEKEAASNQMLLIESAKQARPARFAYNYAKKHLLGESKGSEAEQKVAELEAKIAKLEALATANAVTPTQAGNTGPGTAASGDEVDLLESVTSTRF